jgi:phosphoribosylaminoimidazole (AIR) synthetase
MALADVFRSNGISSLRKALAMKYGPQWWNNPEAMEDIIAAAEGSAQYDRFLNSLQGWFNPPSFKSIMDLHLIVHLSGGAFKSKLADDILKKTGLSAEITDLFPPAPIMKKCAGWRGMDSEECYETWNGGQGALAVIDPQYEEYFIGLAKNFGIRAKKAGIITEKKEYSVRIRSMFDEKEKYIEY